MCVYGFGEFRSDLISGEWEMHFPGILLCFLVMVSLFLFFVVLGSIN